MKLFFLLDISYRIDNYNFQVLKSSTMEHTKVKERKNQGLEGLKFQVSIQLWNKVCDKLITNNDNEFELRSYTK
jgi:hypothetical protein